MQRIKSPLAAIAMYSNIIGAIHLLHGNPTLLIQLMMVAGPQNLTPTQLRLRGSVLLITIRTAEGLRLEEVGLEPPPFILFLLVLLHSKCMVFLVCIPSISCCLYDLHSLFLGDLKVATFQLFLIESHFGFASRSLHDTLTVFLSIRLEQRLISYLIVLN